MMITLFVAITVDNQSLIDSHVKNPEENSELRFLNLHFIPSRAVTLALTLFAVVWHNDRLVVGCR